MSLLTSLFSQIDLNPPEGDRINFLGLVVLLYRVLCPVVAE
jgi:hypothetical protein